MSDLLDQHEQTEATTPQKQVSGDVERALQLALAYIDYVRDYHPRVHEEANGLPPIDKIILGTLQTQPREAFTNHIPKSEANLKPSTLFTQPREE